MDAVDFLKEAVRMHNFDGHDCVECEIYKHSNGNFSCVNWVLSHPDEAVNVVKQWTKEHPRKTRQNELLKLFPRVSMTADDVIAFCPESMDSAFVCSIKERDHCDPECGECRKKYWNEETENEKEHN